MCNRCLCCLLAGDREAARAAGDGVPAAAGGGQGAGRGPVLHGLPVLPAQGRLPAAQLTLPAARAAPGISSRLAPGTGSSDAGSWLVGTALRPVVPVGSRGGRLTAGTVRLVSAGGCDRGRPSQPQRFTELPTPCSLLCATHKLFFKVYRLG